MDPKSQGKHERDRFIVEKGQQDEGRVQGKAWNCRTNRTAKQEGKTRTDQQLTQSKQNKVLRKRQTQESILV
jgi:hypothetical protein